MSVNRLQSSSVRQLLGAGASTTTTGTGVIAGSTLCSYQATITTSVGNGTAVILIEGSNDNTNWCSSALVTINLAGVSGTTDGITISSAFKYVRARVTSITGTTALVVANIGVVV